MVEGMTSLNLCAAQFHADSLQWLRFCNAPECSLEGALRQQEDEWLVDRQFMETLTNKYDCHLLEMGIKTQLTSLQRREHVTWQEMRTITQSAAQCRHY